MRDAGTIATEVANRSIARREFSGLVAALAGFVALPPMARAAAQPRFAPARPFSWDVLVQQARALAARPWAEPQVSPHAVADFDAVGKLTYGPAQALGGDVRLFPTARGTSPHAVTLHLVENGSARQLVDARGLFVGGKQADPAGFRVMTQDQHSDWLAFLGASYFRSSGSRDQYGLSARGIAVDTALPKAEEFPAFTEFWIENLGPDRVRIHALLDGPSVTGAYAFDCRKGTAGVTQDVRAALFFRRDVERLGAAPITSMFWYDQSDSAKRADWRPEIHDSDGLAIWTGSGERIWVPLSNPAANRTNALRADHVKGFGLLQRDQAFDHYQDDGAFYDRRPSLWVEPQGDWGAGTVMLYRMPTGSETQDNVAAFWVSDQPAKAGQGREFAYRLTWTSQDPTAGTAARCVDSWQGAAGRPGDEPVSQEARKFVFDFDGPALRGLGRDSGVTAATNLPPKALLHAAAYPVAGQDGRWRVTLDVRPAAVPSPEFRLYLKRGDQALSETVIQGVQP
ncbi:glucan biosynthesis protein [Novosphingobium aerophilum]|uniref:glucan biosynthesis protein n=1 Tax=Novosphingobium TaxID=165696 RepID=UPI002D769F6A|nr:glucan biosynthesis protein [Novosphingobium sp. RL4]WRT92544.1 glucan biosynthesis protein [Novosphingobium sp. RL4]